MPDCAQDCNDNGIPDVNDIADGTSADCNGNAIPDECIDLENDCNDNGIPDECIDQEDDCNGNGAPDACDVASGTSLDCNSNGVPDECDMPDCNGNSIPDECDIGSGTSTDFNGNGIPDECDAVPPNNNCANAGVITDGTYPFSTLGATTDGLATFCDGNASIIAKDIWFAYTAPCGGTATFSVCNDATFDTLLAVYFATGCPPGASLACSNNAPGCGNTSYVELDVFAGLPYLIRVGGMSGGGTGTLTVSCINPLPGDLDGDGTVGVADLMLLLAHFGACPETCPEDIDGDGLVGIADLLVVLSNWG